MISIQKWSYDLLNKFENLILKNKKSHKQSLVSECFAKTNYFKFECEYFEYLIFSRKINIFNI
jgi:hypothetical protein